MSLRHLGVCCLLRNTREEGPSQEESGGDRRQEGVCDEVGGG